MCIRLFGFLDFLKHLSTSCKGQPGEVSASIRCGRRCLLSPYCPDGICLLQGQRGARLRCSSGVVKAWRLYFFLAHRSCFCGYIGLHEELNLADATISPSFPRHLSHTKKVAPATQLLDAESDSVFSVQLPRRSDLHKNALSRVVEVYLCLRSS